MMPSSSELEYFLEVSKTLNFSRAAERLGVTQPTLSLAMQRLEQAVGSRLFLRTKSGVQLTASGAKLACRAQDLYQAWDRLREETLKDEREIRGQYTIGCHPSVGLYALPSFLRYFLENYPALELKLVHDLSRKITEDVISFRIDFGIVVNPVEHPDLVVQEIGRDKVTFWTRQNPTPLQNPDSPFSVLIYDPNLIQSQALLKQPVGKFSRQVTSSNLEVIAAMVASGAGVGILPGRVATRIQSYALTPLPNKPPQFEDRICLVYRADYQKTQASKLFAHKLRELLTPDATHY
jgi:LysR family transcriptional regulator, cell division regulator